MSIRRTGLSLCVAVVTTLSLAACGGDDNAGSADAASIDAASTSIDATVIDARVYPDAIPVVSLPCDGVSPTSPVLGLQVCARYDDIDGTCTVTNDPDLCGFPPGNTAELRMFWFTPAAITVTGFHDIVTASAGSVHRRDILTLANSTIDNIPEATDFTMTVRRNARQTWSFLLRVENRTARILDVNPVTVGQDCPGAASAAIPYHCTKLGTPHWTLADWQMFATTDLLGAAKQVYSKHLYYATANALGPDKTQPHDPPYDTEVAAGVAGTAFTPKTSFAAAEFLDVAWMGMIVPSAGAPTAASPDFASGAVIDGEPLAVDADLHRVVDISGTTVYQPWDVQFDSRYPTLSQISADFAGMSPSHLPLVFGETNTPNAPSMFPGNYELHVRVLGSDHQGWDVAIPFTVTP